MDRLLKRQAAPLPWPDFLQPVAIATALVLALVAALGIGFASGERERALEQERRVLDAHNRLADGQLSAKINRVRRLLQSIAVELAAQPTVDAAVHEALLAEHRHDFPELRTLALVGVDGRIAASSNPTLHGFDASQRDYFTAHRGRLSGSDFHVTRPFVSVFGDAAVVFSFASRDAYGRLRGIVIASVTGRFFESAVLPFSPHGKGAAVAIFNQDGDLLYRLPDAHLASDADRQRFPTLPLAERRMTTVDGDGIERIYAYREISDSGIAVAASMPLAEVLGDWRHNVLLSALIVGVVAAATLFLAWTAQRRQHRARASEAFAKRLIETANVMLIGLNARGEVVAFNAAAEEISGYRRDEMLGRRWFDTVLPRGHDPATWALLRAAGGGRIPPSVEYPLLTRDGRLRLIAWRNSPIRDERANIATITFGIDISERAQLEAVRRSEEISRHLVAIQEEERHRLAVELHDRTGPNLSALEINWKLLADSVYGKLPEDAAHLLDDASALIDDTVESIREISTEFRPPVLDHAGFWPAVEGYAQHFSRRTGIVVAAEPPQRDLRLPPEVETNLFRIVQEALANSARHSRAKTVRIAQTVRGDGLRLLIADDGSGFDPRHPPTPGHGLHTMQKRAEFIGGRFSLESGPGRGTRIAVELALGELRAAPPGRWDHYSI
ncbi:MAG TPA: PAS domain S-box protein [Azospira sp.]|nr:PAS domain S-box protein [Azospira sp.]